MPGTVDPCPPELGEHIGKLLAELGYDEAEREPLRENDVIA